MSMSPSDSPGGAKGNWKKLVAIWKFISLANSQSAKAPAKQLIFDKYCVGKKIANGAFGQLRLGKHVDTQETVAIKLEPQSAKMPMLFLEYRFYKYLTREMGFPKIHHFGSCGRYNALVMDFLGPNLEELFMTCNRSFSLSTVLQIGIQLVTRMEVIHSHGIIYRDVKPENFVIGRYCHAKSNIIHIVDFGLAKEYIDPETGRHIAYSENKCLTGTVRYMSIAAQQGKEQSRRDDMEALCHVLFYFLTKGNLPWQGAPCEDIKQRYQIIGYIKEETSTTKLGKNFPWEFTVFLKYCRSLKFSQCPDYNYLRGLFRGCLKRLGYQESYVFDWMIPININKQKSSNGISECKTPAVETENRKIGNPSSSNSNKNEGEKKFLPVPGLSTNLSRKQSYCLPASQNSYQKLKALRQCKSLPSSLDGCQSSFQILELRKERKQISTGDNVEANKKSIKPDEKDSIKKEEPEIPGRVPQRCPTIPIPLIRIDTCYTNSIDGNPLEEETIHNHPAVYNEISWTSSSNRLSSAWLSLQKDYLGLKHISNKLQGFFQKHREIFNSPSHNTPKRALNEIDSDRPISFSFCCPVLNFS